MIKLFTKKNNKFSPFKKQSKAFVMIFAIILSTVIFSIALGVSQIALKESQFTTSGIDANNAFYAADAGAECAMYMDQNASSSPFSTVGLSGTINCSDLLVSPIVSHFTGTVTDLSIALPNLTNPTDTTIDKCSQVNINKDQATGDTIITSSGFSKAQVSGTDCNPLDHTVERQLEVTY